MAVGLSGKAVVASFASAALGWRLVAAFRVVVVVERVRRVVELACLVVGEPSGATVARIGEDRHTVVLAGGWRARGVSGVGLFLGGQRRTVALSLFDVDRGRLLGDRLLLARRGRRPVGLRLGCRTRLSGAVAARVFSVLAGGRLDPAGRLLATTGGRRILDLPRRCTAPVPTLGARRTATLVRGRVTPSAAITTSRCGLSCQTRSAGWISSNAAGRKITCSKTEARFAGTSLGSQPISQSQSNTSAK
jgi:hypothetical protein